MLPLCSVNSESIKIYIPVPILYNHAGADFAYVYVCLPISLCGGASVDLRCIVYGQACVKLCNVASAINSNNVW